MTSTGWEILIPAIATFLTSLAAYLKARTAKKVADRNKIQLLIHEDGLMHSDYYRKNRLPK